MSSRRQMLEFLSLSRLPSEFQEVEYLESSGTQYIDSGIVITNNHKLEMVYHKKTLPTTNSQWVFGTRISSNNNAFGINYYVTSVVVQAPYYKWLNQDQPISNNYYNEKVNIIFDLPNLSLSFEQESYNMILSLASGTIANSYSLFLFALNQSGNAANISSDLQIYSCQIYDNNVLVRDFIPCYRKADGVIGLYDAVNGVFYTNAGTGTFTKGADL